MLKDIKHFIRRRLTPPAPQWPFVRGDYTVVDATAQVVVATANHESFGKALAARPPAGLCMAAALHTPSDVADLLRAVSANLSIESVICAGEDSAKRPLNTALLKLGRDDEIPDGVVGSLMNSIAAQLDATELSALRRRVEFVDMLGCGDLGKITAQVESAAAGSQGANVGFVTQETESGVPRLVLPRDTRYSAKSDKTGRFKISLEEQSIAVEHYSGKNELLRVIEGKTARDICLAIIRNGWVSRLDHAAYLGRELARAETALREGRSFKQDSVEPVDALQSSAER